MCISFLFNRFVRSIVCLWSTAINATESSLCGPDYFFTKSTGCYRPKSSIRLQFVHTKSIKSFDVCTVSLHFVCAYVSLSLDAFVYHFYNNFVLMQTIYEFHGVHQREDEISFVISFFLSFSTIYLILCHATHKIRANEMHFA